MSVEKIPTSDSGDDLPPTLPDCADGNSAATPLPSYWCGPEPIVPTIPGYEVLERLGRGGMGVVYKAQQRALKRFVALKMLRDGALADGEQRARFRGEAEAVARLHHPHIVQIYEIGEHENRPYLALEFAEGGSLAKRLTHGPLPREEAVILMEQVARAVHAAHEANVIHRDLTPANILLAADGSPRISDFGLAKRLDHEVTQTASGQVLGTPSYMAPEQAAGQGKRVGVATDVYALGAILYELLAGRPPFRAPSPMETLSLVLSQEPVAPRRLDAQLPRDLETICLKCLHKEPLKRYASALELADDLRRWRDGESIHARPTPAWERAARWTRRRPAAATLLIVSVLGMLSLAGGVAWHTAELEDALQFAQQQEAEARRNHERALRHERELESQLHAVDVRSAYRLWKNGQAERALRRLEQSQPALDEETHSFDWRYLWRLCHEDAPVCLRGENGEALAAAFAPDGATLAVVHADGTIRLWATATWQPGRVLHGPRRAVCGLFFSTDGRSLFAAGADGVRRWDVAGGEACPLAEPDRRVTLWRPSPDGRLLATVREDSSITLHPADDVTRTLWKATLSEPVEVLTFAGGGHLLACGCRDGAVRLWDVAGGGECGTFYHGSAITALTLTRDGRVVAVAQSNGTITLHVRTGGETIRFRSHEGAVRCVAFSPDHDLLASVGDDNIVRLWDPCTGEPYNALRGHAGRVNGVAFAPDGRSLATVSSHGAVRLWDPNVRKDRQALLPPAPATTRLVWSPDGRLAATAGRDRGIRLWDTMNWREIGRLAGHFGDINDLVFSRDGRTLATASADRTVQIWDTTTRRSRACLVHATAVRCIGFTADGRTLAAGEESGALALWDATTGARLRDLDRAGGPLRALAISADGRILADAAERTVRLWQSANWQRTRTLALGDRVIHLALSADGKTLATTETTGAVILWDVESGARLSGLAGPSGSYQSALFSPDGRTLVLVGRNSPLTLWDVSRPEAPRPRYRLWDGAELVGAAFAPDGGELAAAHRDGRLTIWNANDGKTRRPVGPVSGPILSLAFAPAGDVLVTASGTTAGWTRHTNRVLGRDMHLDSLLSADCDEALHCWDVASGERRCLLPAQSAVLRPDRLVFASDGRTLATAQADGTVWLWDVPTRRRRAVLSTSLRASWWHLGEKAVLGGMPARPLKPAPIRALAFTPDGATLAVIAPDGEVQLWDTERGAFLASLAGERTSTHCLAISPDGRTLATHRCGEVELWDLETRQRRATKRLHREATIRSLAFSPDGRWLASGASDCSVTLWHLFDDRDIHLSGHTDSVSALAFTPDGRTLATAGYDRTVRLWDVATAQEVLKLEGHTGKVHCLAFAPDGRTLATGGESPHGSGEAYLWRAAPYR